MGMLTPLLIRNDALHLMRENPKEFVENITDMISRYEDGSVSCGNHGNAAEILHTQHADIPRLIMVAGNTMIEFNRPERSHEFYTRCIKDAKRILKQYEAELKALDNE